jgi:hypothetical protein
MPDFSAARAPKPTTITVPLGTETVEITFDANKVTKPWMDLRIAEALPEAILSWNMTENGQPMAVTVDNFDRCPYPLLHLIIQTMLEAVTPSDAEGNASPPSSDAPPSATSDPGSQSSPNGSATEPSQTSSESLPVT